MRGRPKGHNLTTIGLPAKKGKDIHRPQAFIGLHTSFKEKGWLCSAFMKHSIFNVHFLCFAVILNWFVDPPVTTAAINSDKLIEEDDVECMPEKIPCSVLDENVDIYLVRRYFTSDAWKIVEDVMKNKAEINAWQCTTCQHDLHSKESIICDCCLQWYHFSCVGLTKMPKRKNWFCRSCS